MHHAVLSCIVFQPVKEKPKRKGPPEALPKDSEDWSVYDAPDEVQQ